MTIKWEFEWCKLCERPNKIGFSVSDEDWEKIVGKREENTVICYNCFERLSYEKNIPFTLKRLFPVARIEGCKFENGGGK